MLACLDMLEKSMRENTSQSFQKNLWLEPRFSQPRGAPVRAERQGVSPTKSMDGRFDRPRSDYQKITKSNLVL